LSNAGCEGDDEVEFPPSSMRMTLPIFPRIMT
jgi:hypothetical protein